MKILLIRSGERFSREANITGIYPPLGLAYIASVLKKADYEVCFLDNQIECLCGKALQHKIKKIAPDVVLLSAMTSSWPGLIRLSRLVKDISPEIIIGVGGPHLSIYPEESLSLTTFDFGIYGEGERTILEALKAIRERRGLDNIKGCVFRKDGKVIVNPPAEEISDLDSIPFPAVDMFPYKKYFALSVKHPFFPVVTSRGCPYACSFCLQGYLGAYRARSAENVVEEMEMLVKKYNIREIIVFDETFAVEEERVLRICELINKKKIKFTWDIRTRVNLLNERILKSLKGAGCRRIHVGIESGSQEILNRMNKGITVPEIERKTAMAKKFGFELRGYFMLAYPGETRRDIYRTIEFAKKLPLDWASFSITVGGPGTELYKEALKSGYFNIDYWKEYAKGNVMDVRPYFIPEGLKEEDLYALKRDAYLRFYFRPRIMWNLLRNAGLTQGFGNFGIFLRLVSAAHHSITRV